MTRPELHKLFGNRHLPDYSSLLKVGTGISLHDPTETPMTIGDVTTIDRRSKGKSRHHSLNKLDVVGMDIGYGSGISPGGYRYCITLVDFATHTLFFYGLSSLKGGDIQDALWRFLIDAGGTPKAIQCDFDPKFLGGAVRRFIESLRIKLRSAPPKRQSSNGMVERYWRSAIRMARSFLAEAKLPTRLWFWAMREACQRMNLIPVRLRGKSGKLKWTTPLETFYGIKPDYRVLFPFGSTGYFRREEDGARNRKTHEAHSFVGIAVGRSDFANAMIFYNPDTQDFCVSGDYKLDTTRGIQDAFPSLSYDGGLQMSLFNGKENSAEDLPPGSKVHIHVSASDSDIPEQLSGTVVHPPTRHNHKYSVQIENSATILDADPSDVWINATFSDAATKTPGLNIDPIKPMWL
jgi:hypothetical protein